MTYAEAVEFVAIARKSGAAFCEANSAKLQQALHIKTEWAIANVPGVARRVAEQRAQFARAGLVKA